MGIASNHLNVAGRLRDELGINSTVASDAEDSAAITHGAKLIRRYNDTFAGAAFNSFGNNDTGAITADDLIAATMLSIAIDEYSSAAIKPSAILALWEFRDEASALLAGLPADRDLHTFTPGEFQDLLENAASPGVKLYGLLRGRGSLPRVATHKLLARKRPKLFPIRDTVVEKALDLHRPNAPWWRPWWATLREDPAIVAHLEAIRRAADVPELSLLRVADIVIWLQNR